MKITKQQLKKVIKEELSMLLREWNSGQEEAVEAWKAGNPKPLYSWLQVYVNRINRYKDQNAKIGLDEVVFDKKSKTERYVKEVGLIEIDRLLTVLPEERGKISQDMWKEWEKLQHDYINNYINPAFKYATKASQKNDLKNLKIPTGVTYNLVGGELELGENYPPPREDPLKTFRTTRMEEPAPNYPTSFPEGRPHTLGHLKDSPPRPK